MQAYKLDSIEILRSCLAETYQVYEPRNIDDATIAWQKFNVSKPEPFEIPMQPTQFPAKSFFFAEREQLFRFDGKNFIASIPEPEPQALLGVTACDLTAIAYQDRFFKADFYYQARRQATLLVGIDCTQPCDGGFCHAVDAGPNVITETADLIISDIANEGTGSNYILIATNDLGTEAVKGLDLEEADNGWNKRRQHLKDDTIKKFPDSSYINKGAELLNSGSITAETWETLGIQCLTCSGCTSLCPTCSCYTHYEVKDTNTQTSLTERCWDSCLFEGFQKESSGHNPSATPGQRVERYWYHKFSDDFVDEFSRYGCVGCGRCEHVCPGAIGVHTTMQTIVAKNNKPEPKSS